MMRTSRTSQLSQVELTRWRILDGILLVLIDKGPKKRLIFSMKPLETFNKAFSLFYPFWPCQYPLPLVNVFKLSGMRRIKNYMKTMGDERLSYLSLLHVQHQMSIDAEAVIHQFIALKNRKMNFIWSKLK